MAQVNVAFGVDEEILVNEGVIFEHVVQKGIAEREYREVVKLGNALMLRSTYALVPGSENLSMIHTKSPPNVIVLNMRAKTLIASETDTSSATILRHTPDSQSLATWADLIDPSLGAHKN